MSYETTFKTGDDVEAGIGEDHDTGRITNPPAHALAMSRAPDAVWVTWGSGASTWTPAELLRPRQRE